MAEQKEVLENGVKRTWWKECVVYQIYPRSFKDSNGDGIGDLRGIIEKLDYIKNLGADAIWISPIFDSPNDDNGYDIRNYRTIMEEFGTMEDYDELISEMKKRDLKFIVDMVGNHTSDEHQWFQEARKSKDNPYRDYYHWREGDGENPPNDWISWFSGSAWSKDDATGEYYLHLFSKKQPDLNWENPKLRQEMYDIMRFYLEKGAAGFRLDAFPFISKNTAFPNFPENFDGDFAKVYASGPNLHKYVQEMHQEVFVGRDEVFSIGEIVGIEVEDIPLLIGEDRKELSTAFHFGNVGVDRDPTNWWIWQDWKLPDLKKLYTLYEEVYHPHSWNTIFFSNHDNPRMVSRFGNDSDEFRDLSAKLLSTLLLTMKGTPFIYQGDELAMTNSPFKSVHEMDDIMTRNAHQDEVVEGGADEEAWMTNMWHIARDHSRTPMQWDDSAHGGFTTADNAWFAVNKNFDKINAAESTANKDSVYHYYRELIALRKEEMVLVYGDFKDLDTKHLEVFAYTRTLGEEKVLVLLNFSDTETTYPLPEGMNIQQKLQGNYSSEGYSGVLQPWEAIIFRVQ